MVVPIVVISALSISVLCNAYQLYLLRLGNTKIKSLEQTIQDQPKAAPTLEVKHLLHDLTKRGHAVLEVKVMDLEGLMYWNR